MTNLEILNLYTALDNLIQNNEIKLPLKTGYVLIKNKKLLSPQYEVIEELRGQVVKEYGQMNEDNKFFIPEDRIDEANNKLINILLLEEDVELQKIKIDDLNEILPINVIEGLMPILEE